MSPQVTSSATSRTVSTIISELPALTSGFSSITATGCRSKRVRGGGKIRALCRIVYLVAISVRGQGGGRKTCAGQARVEMMHRHCFHCSLLRFVLFAVRVFPHSPTPCPPSPSPCPSLNLMYETLKLNTPTNSLPHTHLRNWRVREFRGKVFEGRWDEEGGKRARGSY